MPGPEAWLGALVVGYLLWRLLRPKQKKPPLVRTGVTVTRGLPSPPEDVPKRGAPMPAPSQWLARWQIRYRDVDGVETDRIVRLISVQPRLEKLHVWCELRQDQRTLHFSGLRNVVDPDSGHAVDMRIWLKAYQDSRRRNPVTPATP